MSASPSHSSIDRGLYKMSWYTQALTTQTHTHPNTHHISKLNCKKKKKKRERDWQCMFYGKYNLPDTVNQLIGTDFKRWNPLSTKIKMSAGRQSVKKMTSRSEISSTWSLFPQSEVELRFNFCTGFRTRPPGAETPVPFLNLHHYRLKEVFIRSTVPCY